MPEIIPRPLNQQEKQCLLDALSRFWTVLGSSEYELVGSPPTHHELAETLARDQPLQSIHKAVEDLLGRAFAQDIIRMRADGLIELGAQIENELFNGRVPQQGVQI